MMPVRSGQAWLGLFTLAAMACSKGIAGSVDKRVAPDGVGGLEVLALTPDADFLDSLRTSCRPGPGEDSTGFMQIRTRFEAWQETVDEYGKRDLRGASPETLDSVRIARDSVTAILTRLDRVDALLYPRAAAIAADTAHTDSTGAFMLRRVSASTPYLIVIKARPVVWSFNDRTNASIGGNFRRVMASCEF
jgi:hypothetical protein